MRTSRRRAWTRRLQWANVRAWPTVLAIRAAASVVAASPIAGLELLPAGHAELVMSGAMNAERLDDILSELREAYELILFDLPAPGDMGPALPIAQRLDAALLVLPSEAVSETQARCAAARMDADDIPLAGAVLTCCSDYPPRGSKRGLSTPSGAAPHTL